MDSAEPARHRPSPCAKQSGAQQLVGQPPQDPGGVGLVAAERAGAHGVGEDATHRRVDRGDAVDGGHQRLPHGHPCALGSVARGRGGSGRSARSRRRSRSAARRVRRAPGQCALGRSTRRPRRVRDRCREPGTVGGQRPQLDHGLGRCRGHAHSRMSRTPIRQVERRNSTPGWRPAAADSQTPSFRVAAPPPRAGRPSICRALLSQKNGQLGSRRVFRCGDGRRGGPRPADRAEAPCERLARLDPAGGIVRPAERGLNQ
jgi:hypothetical protein